MAGLEKVVLDHFHGGRWRRLSKFGPTVSNILSEIVHNDVEEIATAKLTAQLPEFEQLEHNKITAIVGRGRNVDMQNIGVKPMDECLKVVHFTSKLMIFCARRKLLVCQRREVSSASPGQVRMN